MGFCLGEKKRSEEEAKTLRRRNDQYLRQNSCCCCGQVLNLTPFDLDFLFNFRYLEFRFVIVCVGCSEEEAKKKIYSVSTVAYTGFGALISEELSHKVKGTSFRV